MSQPFRSSKWILCLSLFSLLVFALMGVATLAQEGDSGTVTLSTTADPVTLTGVKILWPPSISELCGIIDIYGTANVPNMTDWLVEEIELNADLSVPENGGWAPLNQGVNENPVSADILVSVDTRAAPNGLYALRLTVNVNNDGQLVSFHDVVGPIRVNNNIPNCPYDQPDRQVPTPSVPEDNTPRVMPAPGVGASNLRYCDLADNERCPRAGLLMEGRTAEVLGVSANGTGWYLVRTDNGITGWIAPFVVTLSGDFSNVPVTAPPQPLPPRPKPARVVPVSIGIQGQTVCQQPFTVQVQVQNLGETGSPSGTVTIQDIHLSTGQVTTTTFASYPALSPGQMYTASSTLSLDVYFNEEHELRATNEGEEIRFRYVLARGNCGQTTEPPVPPQPNPPITRDFAPGECTVNGVANAPLHQFPNGPVIGQVGPAGATFNVVRGIRTNGELWFQLEGEMDNPGGWIRNRNAPFNQDVCQI